MVLVFCFPAILLTWIFKVVKKILAKVFEKKQTSDFAGLVVGWLGINSSVAPSDPTSFLLHKLLLRQRTLVAKVLLASSIFGGIYWAGRARSNPTGCGTKSPSRFFQRGWGRTSPVGERSLHWVKLWPSVVVGFGWAWLLRPVLALGRRRGLRLHRFSRDQRVHSPSFSNCCTGGKCFSLFFCVLPRVIRPGYQSWPVGVWLLGGIVAIAEAKKLRLLRARCYYGYS